MNARSASSTADWLSRKARVELFAVELREEKRWSRRSHHPGIGSGSVWNDGAHFVDVSHRQPVCKLPQKFDFLIRDHQRSNIPSRAEAILGVAVTNAPSI